MEDSDHSVDISITGMSCASCVSTVENALRKISEVESASVNLATEKAHVEIKKRHVISTANYYKGCC